MNGKRPGGWVALAVRYYRDPKFARLSAEAVVLWINGLCYCGEQETDGYIPANVVSTLTHVDTKRPPNTARALVTAGLWSRVPGGYTIPPETYSRWQETSEQKAAARARNAERQAQYRARHGGSNTSRNAPSVVGAEVGHSPLPPAPRREREHQHQEDPSPLGWEEYIDAAGNLYVRNVANGQADAEAEQ